MAGFIHIRQLTCAKRKRVVKTKEGEKEVEEKYYRICIPPHVIRELGWEEGDFIKMKVENGRLVLELHAKGV